MSAQSGRNYLSGLWEQKREVWLDGVLREVARRIPCPLGEPCWQPRDALADHLRFAECLQRNLPQPSVVSQPLFRSPCLRERQASAGIRLQPDR